MKFRGLVHSCVVTALLLAALPAMAVTVDLISIQDGTLFQDPPDGASGSGITMFVGQTAFLGSRRGVILFDIAGSIPAGSTITSATLTLTVDGAGPLSGNDRFDLHRLGESWGEAGSDAGQLGGASVPAQNGDATWDDRFFSFGLAWTNAGGTFNPTSSSMTIPPTSNGAAATWPSTPNLVADVQTMLDVPGSNHGWIIIGDETAVRTARRFFTRESAFRPVLRINYDPPMASGSGDVRNLLVDKAGANTYRLAWDASCQATDSDYEVYEGTIGTYYSHTRIQCSTAGGLTTSVSPPPASSTYYLIVPTNTTEEGSYGFDSTFTGRPLGVVVCLPQVLSTPLCP